MDEIPKCDYHLKATEQYFPVVSFVAHSFATYCLLQVDFSHSLCSHQKSLGTGMGGQSVEDLERVIAAMRRVVERLQGENDQLKKTVGAGGPQYGEVIKENKRLKVNCFVF